MDYKKVVTKLYSELEDALNDGYKNNHEVHDHLRDYVPDVSHNNALPRLVDREATAEREHRRFMPGWSDHHGKISVGVAAKLMVLHNIAVGARLKAMPPATDFIQFRPSAVEAHLVGFLLRDVLKADWIEAAHDLDYSEAVKP